MTPLPSALRGSIEVVGWRLDQAIYKNTWDSGQGAYLFGGRWNSAGRKVVYCSLDPATAIVEVAVHKGFHVLDTVAHVLTGCKIVSGKTIRIVEPDEIPNPNWLFPGIVTSGQQKFGDNLLSKHGMIIIPSVVSRNSWNLLFDSTICVRDTDYSVFSQERFALDPRLPPPP